MKSPLALLAIASLCAAAPAAPQADAQPSPLNNTRDSGYRGIWFALGQKCEYGDKYSGGLGTYTANHVPMAVYAPQAQKTFFVYGGAKEGQRHLLAMASHFDHRTGTVPRPTIVHDKQGVDDPHDNPSLCIDGKGHLWIFVSGRAKKRPGYIYRSAEPFSTDRFELVAVREFTYPQPRWIDGPGFILLFTKYTGVRELYFGTSPDGQSWSPDRKFAGIGGHYQTSHQIDRRIVTAFNMHPGGAVDKRTNLYFLQTDDLGATWRTAAGQAVAIPLEQPDNPALVRDYRPEKRLVYIHDIDADPSSGHPVVLYVTSADFQPGPSGDPRWWTIARYDGASWHYAEFAPANHNYTTGSLHLENDAWRVFGPTEPGPQRIGAGGELAIWTSRDRGKTWTRQRQLTSGSPRNHNYVRRPLHAHPGFYAFWADGDPDAFSPSYLHFADRDGNVWRLPYEMPGDRATPERLAN